MTYFKHSYRKKLIVATIAIVIYALSFWEHMRLPLVVGGETKSLLFTISCTLAFATLLILNGIPFRMEMEIWEYPDRETIGAIIKKERKIITPIVVLNAVVFITCLTIFVKTLIGHCPTIDMILSTVLMVVVAIVATMNEVYFVRRRELCVALATS